MRPWHLWLAALPLGCSGGGAAPGHDAAVDAATDAGAGPDAAMDAGWAPPETCPPPGAAVVRTFAGRAAFGVARALPDDDGSPVRQDAIESSAVAGVSTLRADLLWDRIEPARGQFDFSGADRIIGDLEAAGLEPLPILCYGTPWASHSGDAGAPPDDPADFAAFASETVARYAGRVPAWEVWNEQNAFRFWPPAADPAAYAVLLAAASTAIRSADPEALVIYGGLFGPTLRILDSEIVAGADLFLARTLEAAPDLGESFDIVAIHPYRYPFTAPESSAPGQPRLDDAIGATRAVLAAHGLDKPLWITEVGWHTSPGAVSRGVSRQDQARFLVRGHVIAFGAGVQRVYWYTTRDEEAWQTDQEAAFGWRDVDGAPKPAYGAHRLLVDLVGDATEIADLRPEVCTRGEHAYRFTGPGGRVTVAWIPDPGGSATITLDAAGPNAELVSWMGEREPISATAGRYQVPITEDPVFLVER